MTFKDLYTELLDLTDTNTTANSVFAKRAIIRALKWVINSHNFLHNETLVNITEAALSEELSLPVDCGKLISVEFTGTGVYVPIYTQRELQAKQVEYNLQNTGTIDDPSFYADYMSTVNGVALIQLGSKFKFYPELMAATNLTLFYDKVVPDTLEDTATHFLINEFPSLLIAKAVQSTFKLRMKQEAVALFPNEVLYSELQSAIDWDLNLRKTIRDF